MYNLSGGNNKIELVTNVFLNGNSDLQEAHQWKEKIADMLKKVPYKAEVLKPAIQFLVAALKPAKIYMLEHSDSETSVNEKHYSLSVVLPTPSNTSAEQEAALTIAYMANKNIYFSVHNEGHVMERIRAGNPYYALNFVPENIVYDNNNTVYPVATTEQAAAARQKVKETFTTGYNKAKRFYACAESEFNAGENETTLFMLHQAVELVCRAITKSLNGFEERVHEIKVQRSHIRRFAPELVPIFNEEQNDDKKLLELLEKGYKDGRYNYDFKADANLLPLLFTKVRLFQDMALKIMERITN